MITVFAYGSLMSRSDLRRTVPDATHLGATKLYGYRRIFNLQAAHRIDPITTRPLCVLNLEPSTPADYVNGICFQLPEATFAALQHREKAYQLIEVEVQDYLSPSQSYSCYTFRSAVPNPYPYQLGSGAQQAYLQLCIEACQAYGAAFVDDFRQTTHFWGVDPAQDAPEIWTSLSSLALSHRNNSRFG